MSDLPLEIEELEALDAAEVGYVVKAVCQQCGGPALAGAAVVRAGGAVRCTDCMEAPAADPALAGQYTQAWGWDTHQSLDESVCPVCRSTTRKDKCNWVPSGSHPAPAVGSRERVAATYPSPVLKLAERAREAGWRVRMQYARGCSVHGATGQPLAEKESFALVFYGHEKTGEGAYAVYRGGVWDSVNIGGRILGGVTDLLHWLECGGRPDQLWLEHQMAFVLHAEYLKAQLKERNAEIKKRHAGGASVRFLADRFKITEAEVVTVITPKKSSGAKKESGG